MYARHSTRVQTVRHPETAQLRVDLVRLDADPLADIRHPQKIQAVVLNGRLLDRKALDGIQGRLEASAPNQ